MADDAVSADVPQEAPPVEELPAAEVPVPEPEMQMDISVSESREADVPPNNNETVVVSQTNLAPIASGHVLVRDERKRGNATRLQNRDEHLEKIMAHAREKKEITNDDVEKLLHVSDATASRYLKMLVASGKLMKEGKGRGVQYRVA